VNIENIPFTIPLIPQVTEGERYDTIYDELEEELLTSHRLHMAQLIREKFYHPSSLTMNINLKTNKIIPTSITICGTTYKMIQQ